MLIAERDEGIAEVRQPPGLRFKPWVDGLRETVTLAGHAVPRLIAPREPREERFTERHPQSSAPTSFSTERALSASSETGLLLMTRFRARIPRLPF